jgi:hypothetical protein
MRGAAGVAVRCRTAMATLETDSTKYDYYGNIISIEMLCCLGVEKVNQPVNNSVLKYPFSTKYFSLFACRNSLFFKEQGI